MAASPAIEHLLRRAGFGATPEERGKFARFTVPLAAIALTNFDPAKTDIDAKIGTPGYVGITTRGAFAPNTNITDSRQRWLFRMVHSPAPLQEKMTLFWHHHFATAYSKIAGIVGATDAARMMATKPQEDSTGMKGQIELLREYALGNFRQLLIEIAKDPAMLYWLDGRLNVRAQPQENFGRELMELFTFGVEHYKESDVYAAARVFTGWNLRVTGANGTPTAKYRVLLQLRAARRQRQGLHVSDLRERQHPDRGPRRGERHAGRHRPDQRAGDSSGDRESSGASAVDLVRERGGCA